MRFRDPAAMVLFACAGAFSGMRAEVASAQVCEVRGVLTAPVQDFPGSAAFTSMEFLDIDGDGERELIAGSYANGVWRLSASGWTEVGNLRSSVVSVTMFENELHALTTFGLMRFRNGAWSTVPGTSAIGSNGRTTHVFNDGTGSALYVGISTLGGGATQSAVQRLQNGVLERVGTAGEIGGAVQAMVEFDEDGAGASPPSLFAVGESVTVNSARVLAARWDGTHWTGVGSPLTSGSIVWCKTAGVVKEGPLSGLYVSGHGFPSVAGSSTPKILRWDGIAWGVLPGPHSGNWGAAMEQVSYTILPVVEPSGQTAVYVRGPETYRIDETSVRWVRGVAGGIGPFVGNLQTPLVVVPPEGNTPLTLLGPSATATGFRLGRIAICGHSSADFDGNGVVDVNDLFAYVNAWMQQRREADFRYLTAINLDDLLGYLDAWLRG